MLFARLDGPVATGVRFAEPRRQRPVEREHERPCALVGCALPRRCARQSLACHVAAAVLLLGTFVFVFGFRTPRGALQNERWQAASCTLAATTARFETDRTQIGSSREDLVKLNSVGA